MNPLWYFAIGFVGLCILSLFLGLVSKDSRPGFAGGKTSVKERWFFHGKED